MKIRKWLAAATAGAMALAMAGCSDIDEDFFATAEAGNTTAEYTAEAGNSTAEYTAEAPVQSGGEEEYDNAGRSFDNGATQLSMTNGSLDIHRRTRSESAPMGDSGWTIMVYLCGTDLESECYAASMDIEEALNGRYSDDVRIVYQTGGTAEWNEYYGISNSVSQRYVTNNGELELVDEFDLQNMGDPQTLADFVSWGVDNYPAKHMGLVFWNHGGGSISGVCFDEMNDSDSLSLREIDSALNSVYGQMSDKFEFIGFDACLMSTLETANIIAPYARYMFASEETEPGGGWNYTDIGDCLFWYPDATGADLGEMQCQSYYQHCIDNGDPDGVTFAITDLSKINGLLTAFDATAKEMYESDSMTGIARAVYSADNFGGNNRNEGYTNMVDLLGLLNAVQPYAPSASDAIAKLKEAVIYSVNGDNHEGAGGLSLYYPLSVQGTEELSVFADICISSYYLAYVDSAAYGTTGGDLSDYDNSGLIADCDDIWNYGYTADPNVGSNYSDVSYADDNSTIGIQSVYFDEDGTYTVQLSDMSAFNYATCTLFMTYDGTSVYLGEDDEVVTDYDAMILQDGFDGSWPSIAGQPLAIVAVSVGEDRSVYTAPITLNGEQTNLRIEYDFTSSEWRVCGTWSGIDPETGVASRDTQPLKDGDVIAPAYFVFSDEFNDYIYGDDITVSGELQIEYDALPAADYSYSMSLYDIYGNYYYTTSVTFTVDENGELFFYPDEL